MDKATAKQLLESVLEEHPDLAADIPNKHFRTRKVSQPLRIFAETQELGIKLAEKRGVKPSSIFREAVEIGLRELEEQVNA